MATKFGEWTPAEALFLREWKTRWQTYPDWCDDDWHADTSSLPAYLRWAAKFAGSPDALIAVFDGLAKRDGRPRLDDLKSAAVQSRAARAPTPNERCGVCDGTGVVLVASVSINGRHYICDPQRPIPAPTRYDTGRTRILVGEIQRGTMPCKCDSGQRQAANWHGPNAAASGNLIQRAFERRMARHRDWYDYRRECERLAGLEVREDDGERPPIDAAALARAAIVAQRERDEVAAWAADYPDTTDDTHEAARIDEVF